MLAPLARARIPNLAHRSLQQRRLTFGEQDAAADVGAVVGSAGAAGEAAVAVVDLAGAAVAVVGPAGVVVAAVVAEGAAACPSPE